MSFASTTRRAATVEQSIMTVSLDVAVQPGGPCGVCTHPRADHDTIARRYCGATLDNALTRGCICS